MSNYTDLIFQTSLLKAQQEASREGILVVSPDGHIISYNQRFLKLWQIAPEVILTASDQAVVQSIIGKLSDPASFLDRVNHLYKHPFEESLDEINLLNDSVFERYSAPVISEHNQILGRVWFFRDITQKKISQKKFLDQQIALTNAARLSALGQMSSEIVHEIVNPLTLLDILNAELNKLAIENSASQDLVIAHTEKVEKSITRISKTIIALRTLAHNSADLEMQRASLKEIVNNTLDFCRAKINRYRAKLQIDDYPDDLELVCNPIQISQVLLNLLINSLHAIDDLPEKWINIKVTPRSKEILIEIIDSGKGIPIQIQEKMFSSFFTTKLAGKGTGLGLKISKSIIEAHGGTLEINNNCQNTSIVMTLPKKDLRD